MPKAWTDCTAQEIADWADELGHGKGMDGQIVSVSTVLTLIEHLAMSGNRDIGSEALDLLCAKSNNAGTAKLAYR